MTDLQLSLGRRLKCAKEIMTASETTRVLLGGYGSGKTTAGVQAVLQLCCENPWTPDYKDDHPTFLAIGATDKVLRESTYATWKRVVPQECIRKQWKSPGDWRCLLENGVMVLFRTWGSKIEGVTAFGAWLDEAHLLPDERALLNYVARLRDPHAKKKMMLLTGVPEFCWMYQRFGPESRPADTKIVHASTYDNVALRPEDIERIRQSCAGGDVATYLLGQWAKPRDAVYYEWRPELHLDPKPGDSQKACHLSIDVGERAAVLWWQEGDTYRGPNGERIRGRSLKVVDEMLPERQSARSIMRLVNQRPWLLRPGQTKIYVDPATDRDEQMAIQEGAPGCTVIRWSRGDEAYYVNNGVRCVNAALRDADGNTRLTVYSGLPRERRSLITSIPAIRRKEQDPTKVHKDNKTDHVALDCFRYPVADLLPLRSSGITVHHAQ